MLLAKGLIEELIFRGTPIQAITLIRTTIKEINREGREKGLGPEQHVAYWDSTDDKPDYMIKLPIEVRFQPGDRITLYCCTVVAMDRPDSQARLKVLAPSGVWDKVAQVWQQIKGVMERDGWLIEPVASEPLVRSVPEAQRQETSATPQPIVLQTRSGGRGADPAYDRAHEMIQNGASWQEAFEWFCQSQKIAKADRSVRNSFKQAMGRRNKKGQRNAT